MAFTGIFTTANMINLKAGAQVSATINTEANQNALCLEFEGLISAATRNANIVSNYANLNQYMKSILGLAESCYVAYWMMQNDTTGMALSDFQTRMNVNWATYQDCLKIILDQNTIKAMGA